MSALSDELSRKESDPTENNEKSRQCAEVSPDGVGSQSYMSPSDVTGTHLIRSLSTSKTGK